MLCALFTGSVALFPCCCFWSAELYGLNCCKVRGIRWCEQKCVFCAEHFVVSLSLRGGSAGFSIGMFGRASLGSGFVQGSGEDSGRVLTSHKDNNLYMWSLHISQNQHFLNIFICCFYSLILKIVNSNMFNYSQAYASNLIKSNKKYKSYVHLWCRRSLIYTYKKSQIHIRTN